MKQRLDFQSLPNRLSQLSGGGEGCGMYPATMSWVRILQMTLFFQWWFPAIKSRRFCGPSDLEAV